MPASDVPFYNQAGRLANSIKRWFTLPCAVPTAIYFEAAFEGLWKFVYSVASPDPKEIYHQVVGESLYHSIKDSVNQSEVFDPLEPLPVKRGLFHIADAVDVALWNIFLISSALDGLIDFSSMISKMNPCTTGGSNRRGQGTAYINAISDDGDFQGVDFSWVWGSGLTSAEPCSAQIGIRRAGYCAATTAWETFGAEPVPSAGQIVNVSTNEVMDFDGTDPTVAGNPQATHVFYNTRNESVPLINLEYQCAYTGEINLPLHEAFGINDKFFGYCFNPSRAGP